MTNSLQMPAPTWFVGCGNMGGAVLDGWRLGGLDLGSVTVVRPSGKAVEGVRVVVHEVRQLMPMDIVTRRGLAVTPAARSLIDAAAWSSDRSA